MQYQNIWSFQKHLQSAAPHHLCDVYLIIISDDFERKKILAHTAKVFTLERIMPTSFASLCEEMQSPSLFGGKTLIQFDELELLKTKELQLIQSYLSSPVGSLLLGARSKKGLADLSRAVENLGVILDLSAEKPWDKKQRLFDQLFRKVQAAKKIISREVLMALMEKVGSDPAALEQEMEKLLIYTEGKKQIEMRDIEQILSSVETDSLWKIAEDFIWERNFGRNLTKEYGMNATFFYSMVVALRSQLQTGYQIARLLEEERQGDVVAHFPRMYCKTLEKRTQQARHYGSHYFFQGLEYVFQMELQSKDHLRCYDLLFDLFRSKMQQMMAHV